MFEDYTIMGKNEENNFLLYRLTTYFDPLKGRQYKSPHSYQKYTEWENMIQNPSTKTIYNFIRKYTTLVTEDNVYLP